MTLSFIRSFFIIVSTVVGYYVGTLLKMRGIPLVSAIDIAVLGGMIGCLSGLILIFIEMQLRRVSVRGLSSLVFGLILGIFMAKLISNILELLPLGDFILSISEIVLTLIFSYMGAVIALRGKDEFNVIIPYVRFKKQDVYEGLILLDTSAIIDGRVIDIYKANFLRGRLVIPRSVLTELQKLADSADDIKRQKGRRGLDLVSSMQEDPKIEVRIHEDDVAESQSVDSKLVELAKIMDGSLCTTDYNLSRMAGVQDVEVLNINELANAVKSVIFTGERLSVKLIKEGKEHHQAIAYLEDGTMVVVSNANNYIGQQRDVSVTSVLQTQTGKIIFAKIEN